MKKLILILIAVISVMEICSQVRLFVPETNTPRQENYDTDDGDTATLVPKVLFNIDIRYACVDTVCLVNNSQGFDYYRWDFGDGRTSNYRNPLPLVYTYTGTYIIRLTAGRFSDGYEETITGAIAVNGIFDGVTEDSTCCRTPFIYNGKAYDTPGTFIDTTFTQDSCYILHKLILHHKIAHYTLDDRNLCTGDTVMFGNRLITEEGVYYDTIISKTGCDSILTMRAFKNPKITEINYRRCEGQSISIGVKGKKVNITKSGIYYDTLLSQHGCDSILKYVVNFDPSYLFTDSAQICPGESYTYRGKTYSRPGTYYDRLQCVNTGCDSIYCLKLSYRSYFHEITDTIFTTRLNGYFTWRDNNYYYSGTYIEHYYDINGCDSIYELHLVIDKPWETYLRDTVCEGNPYYFGGKYLTKTGLYVDSLRSMTLSDSVIKLYLQVHPRYNYYDTVRICERSYTYQGKTFTSSGDYEITYTSRYGCDSSYHLNLNLFWNNQYVTEATIDCYNTYYDWRGDRYTNVGEYYEHHTNRHGCDSDFVLKLTWAIHYEEVNICEGDSFMLRGKILKEPGIYMDTLKCIYGFDSLTQITLNVLKTYHFFDTVRICDGSSYDFHGRMVSKAGNYYDSLRTIGGCDSIYHLNLQIAPNFHEIENLTVCTAGHYQWRNKSITQSGTYFDSLKSESGCDSIYELRIVVNPPKMSVINEMICQGDVYSFKGRHYTESGSYYDTMRTSDGCDSIVKLVLNVRPKYVISTRETICKGQSFHYRGRTLTQAGIYNDTLKSVSGCDSIYELELIVSHPSHVIEYDTMCSNETYKWRNRTINQSGVYFDSLVSVTGCDSIFELHLQKNDTYVTVLHQSICKGNSFLFGSRSLSQSGIYYDYLKSANGCDSILKLILNVTPNFVVTERKTICDGDYYTFRGRKVNIDGKYSDSLKMSNGCDSIYELYLTVAHPFLDIKYDTTYANKPYQWRGRTLTHTGTYYDSLVSKTSCDSVFVLHLLYNTSHLIETTIRLCTGESYSFRGRILTEPGVYYDSLKTPQGNDSIFRLNLYKTWDYHFYDTARICQGSTYRFRGRNLSSSGTYYDSLRTIDGCDSIYQLVLTVDTSYFFSEYDSRCTSGAYSWHKRDIRKSGIYYDSLKTRTGCDSIYRLELDLYTPYFIERSVTLCPGQSYPFAGRQITSSGVYFDTLHTVHGCDSIIKLVLNVTPHYEFYDTARICQGEYYPFFGQKLRATSDYTARLKTVAAGCDSIYHLNLTVNPSYHFVELDTVCQNSPYVWRGRYLTETGFYYDSLQTAEGCDSIYELRLIYNDIYYIDRNVSICEGESYYFGGKNYTQAGVYVDTLTSMHGCDSIVKLVVTICRPHHFYDTAVICKGDYYNFHGRRLYNPGLYYDSLRTVKTGCDSIYQLVLKVRKSYHFIERDTLCTDLPYLWRGKEITEKGVYFDSLVTAEGCDSVYELRLELNHIYKFTRNISLCPGESYFYRGKDYSAPGIYVDSLASKFGCDSIITIVVTRDYQHDFYDTAHICSGDFYDFFGRRLISPGDYTEVVKTSVNGCDSIYHLHLVVNPVYVETEYDTICSNDRYLWRGRYYSESGIYYDTVPTISGCDSVFELKLTIFPINMVDIYEEICQGSSFYFRGRNYSQPGIYYDTLTASSGCDSIFRIVVSVSPKYMHSDTVQICSGNTYLFRGRLLSTPGIYHDTVPTMGTGCDSIFELLLQTAPTYHFIEYDTVCSNNTYFWRNIYLTKSGTYFDSLRSSYGCDSVYELRLVINHVPIVDRYIEICQGSSFTYRGRDFSEQGVYYDTIRTVHGCDSILKITVSVLPKYFVSDTVKMCNGATYNFRGRVCTTPGVYRDTLKTVKCGCDSIFEVIIETVHTFHHVEYDTVCSNDTYLWRNKYFTESGIYFDSLRSANGCDSVYELRLVVNHIPIVERYHEICEGSSYFYRGRNISAQGVYYDTILTIHGCDSILKLTLVVTPEYLHSDTVRICDGGTYNFRGKLLSTPGVYRDTVQTIGSGCDSIFEVVIRTVGKFHFIEYDSICTNNTYLWRGRYLTDAGTYFDSLRSVNGCDSIYELRLELHHVIIDTRYIEICDGASFHFRGKNYSAQGVYYDTIQSRFGCDSIIKLVISVTPDYFFSDTVQICSGDFYLFFGRKLRNPGVYYHNLKTVKSGCDSIYELVLRTVPTFHQIDYDTICSSDVYTWRKRLLTATGTYYDSLKSSYGCDSIYEMHLTVYNDIVVERYKEICSGQYFNFYGKNYSAQGVYYDTLITRHGCDSVIKLTLNVIPSYLLSDTVTICSGDTYLFRGKRCSRPGVYRDTLPTVGLGCDSIFELILRTAPLFHHIEYDTVCSDMDYIWHNRSLTSSGIYFDSLMSSHGCDSVYELRLQLNKPHLQVRYISICHGHSFIIRDSVISTQGVYYDTLQTTQGCDSIIRYVVNVTPNYLFSDTAFICDGESYTFRGRVLRNPGIYRDVLTTAVSGCDSIYEIVLNTAPTYHFVQYDTLCTNGNYVWHSRSITSSGIYFDSLKSSNGCDSVYELRVMLNRPYLQVRYVSICQGQSFSLRNRVITTMGIYYDSLLTTQGCDSVIKYVVNVTPNYLFSDTATICQGGIYKFRGRSITNPGTYRDSFLTVGSGCDSIYEIVLYTRPSYHYVELDTICSNEPYVWRGRNLISTGVYYDSLQTVDGCDSIYELRLQYNRSYFYVRNVQLCEGESFYCRGRDFSAQGIYYDTLQTIHGCDSMIKYVVIVSAHYLMTDTAYICDGDVYNFRGRLLTYPGVYKDTTPAVHSGCDSIFVLYLKSYPSYHFIEYDTVCSNGTYLWRGRYLTQTGVYYDSLQTVDLCDSVYELRLIVYPKYLNEYRVDICDGQVYQFHGRRLTAQGIYYDSLQSINGCDSVVKLILTIRPKYMVYDTLTICQGDIYNFHGRYINKSGVYWDTLSSVNGCDSIHQLFLKVAPLFHSIEHDTLCTNGTFHWRNNYYSVTGVYFDSLKSSLGCDSVYELRLTVFNHKVTIIHEEICHGTSFFFNGRQLTQPGTYRDTLTRSSGGCDSIVELVLSVSATYLFERSVTICQGDSFDFRGRHVRLQGVYYDTLQTVRSGCDSIYKLNLTVKKVFHNIINVRQCTNEPYNFNNTIITQSGTYVDSLRTVDGCDSVIELHISFVDPSYSVIHSTICSNQQYTTPTGKTFNQTGVFYDTLLNRMGCDSILEIRLNVIHNISVFDTATFIKGHTYYYRNKSYTSAGVYFDTANSVLGCDTFFQLVLSYEPFMTLYLDTTFCDNHPLHFRGRVYYTSATDTFYLPDLTKAHTDTLLILNAYVVPHSEYHFSDSTCDGTPYFFVDRWLTTSGYYCDTVANFYGCDSIIHLTLTVFDRMDSVQNVTICETESYTWHGRQFVLPGTYYDTLVEASSGCNIYYELHLSVVQETKLVIANLNDTVSVCWDDEYYYITPTFTGALPTIYSITYDDIALQRNNIVNAEYTTSTLIVPIPKDIHDQPVRPDVYSATLSLGNAYCNASSYNAKYDLTVKYPSSVLDQHFNDVVSVFNTHRNGGYTFTHFKWYVNGILVNGSTESNLYLSSLTPGDVVYAELKRESENYFIPTCHLVIEDLGPEPQTYPVMLTASYFLPGKAEARLQSSESGDYKVYDMKGSLISTGEVLPEGETSVSLPYIAGCYLIVVRTDTSYQTFKIVVR